MMCYVSDLKVVRNLSLVSIESVRVLRHFEKFFLLLLHHKAVGQLLFLFRPAGQ
jgi:hypothetical protein